MKRATFAVAGAFTVVLAEGGCAALIGASFDDAGLTQYDAASDVRETSLHFDVADAKPFDPPALPNLAFWLDAHQQVDTNDASNQVLAWRDLSGHVPARDVVQYANWNPPTLNQSGISGQPSVHFEPSGYQLLASSWLGPGSTECTIFVVSQGYPESVLRFQNTAGGPPAVIFPYDNAASEANPSFGLYVATSSDSVFVRSAITPAPTIAAAIWHSSGTVTTYTNSSLIEQRLTTIALPSSTKLFVGGLPIVATTLFTHGDVGEVIVYDSALSDTDRAKVEAYLSVKWSIAL
jgi:hypothetical protein